MRGRRAGDPAELGGAAQREVNHDPSVACVQDPDERHAQRSPRFPERPTNGVGGGGAAGEGRQGYCLEPDGVGNDEREHCT
jgi:hypothetical protein